MKYKSKTFTGKTPEECYQKFSDWRSEYTPVDDKIWETTPYSNLGHICGEWWLLTVIYHDDPHPHM